MGAGIGRRRGPDLQTGGTRRARARIQSAERDRDRGSRQAGGLEPGHARVQVRAHPQGQQGGRPGRRTAGVERRRVSPGRRGRGTRRLQAVVVQLQQGVSERFRFLRPADPGPRQGGPDAHRYAIAGNASRPRQRRGQLDRRRTRGGPRSGHHGDLDPGRRPGGLESLRLHRFGGARRAGAHDHLHDWRRRIARARDRRPFTVDRRQLRAPGRRSRRGHDQGRRGQNPRRAQEPLPARAAREDRR